MTERITRSRNEKNNDKTPKWVKRTGAIALAGAVTFGVYKANEAPVEPERPQNSYSVDASVAVALGDGETLIDAVDRIATKEESAHPGYPTNPKPADALPQLTDSQRNEIVVSAQHATDIHDSQGARLQPQPGEVFVVDVGEFDGDPETDIRVRRATESDHFESLVVSTPGSGMSRNDEVEASYLVKSKPENLPDYYQEK